MTIKHPLLAAAGLILAITGCSDQKQPQTVDPQQASTTQIIQPSVALKKNQGKVINIIDVPGYSYLEVENDGRKFWVAGTPIKVNQGEVVSWEHASLMRNFTSKTLNRTFDEILFVPGFKTSQDSNTSSTVADQPRATVVSVESVADYTFIEAVTESGETVWIAVPTSDVKANDKITWSNASLMHNFTSKSLNRTFPEILFTGTVQVTN
ncbi:MAG: hypothetical protein V7699_00655 [Porticoccus sp.]